MGRYEFMPQCLAAECRLALLDTQVTEHIDDLVLALEIVPPSAMAFGNRAPIYVVVAGY